MADPQQQITEWDANGKPITSAPAVTEWDANGKPINSTAQAAAQITAHPPAAPGVPIPAGLQKTTPPTPGSEGFLKSAGQDLLNVPLGLAKGTSAAFNSWGNPGAAAEEYVPMMQTIVDNAKHRAEEGRSLPYQGAALLGETLLNQNVRGQEDAADAGNVPGVLGHVVGGLPMAALTEEGLRAAARPTPINNLVKGTYSPQGSQIAASLRGSSRFDVPAAASDAHAAISEGLADRGLSPTDFKGRNGPAALQAGIDNALDIHEARAKQIIDPIRDQMVDPAVLNENPELKARFSPEQLKNGLTYGDLDNERIQLNKDLRRANFYSKDPSAQYAVADPLANAHAAADQARNLVYGKAEQITGSNLRPLKQTESALIKLGDLAETTKNGLSAGAAQSETASPLAKTVNAAKKIASIKKNPASSLASLANSPETLDLAGFNKNMQKAFANVKPAPGSVLKNGRLIEPGPGVLTPPRGSVPPELNRQLPLTLEPNPPGYELTSPSGRTPPEIQPHQGALPLTSSYAPMGEHAGLTSKIPGESVPGKNLILTPPPPGKVGPTPLQQILNFSREAHPTDITNIPRSLGAAAAQANAEEIPPLLRQDLPPSGLNPELVRGEDSWRLAAAPGTHNIGPFEWDPVAREMLKRDPLMPRFGEDFSPTGQAILQDFNEPGGHAGGGVISAEEANRPGTHFVFDKSGRPTVHGKSFAPEETPIGGVHITVNKDGTFAVNEGTLTPQTEAGIQRLLRALKGR